jgi:hypothetical protein
MFSDDGYVVHAWTYVDWVAAAKQHLFTNNKPVPDTLEQDMQHQLCLGLPIGFCRYDDDNRPRPNMWLSWNDVAEGLKTFARWVAGGCEYAPQAEAERRAQVCSRCYLNVNVEGCSACYKAVLEITGEKRTKADNTLRTCAVCKCFLKAKVHFPISILDTENSGVQQMYPSHCWLNKESENYRG